MSNETKLLTSPDWSSAPEWAMFHAIDSTGWGSWYEFTPERGAVCFWPGIDEKFENSDVFNDMCDWRNSLQKRPE